jgi:hypothetical protein
MTLPALTLDDLTYEDLRGLAMRSIPAASGGRWTHHAPVDAGITLLELFAFLLEQQLFVMDQVPDSMVSALLALLGDAPRPTRAARTVLVRGEGGPAGYVSLAEGEAFRPTSNALADLVFTSLRPALLPPVSELALMIDGQDATSALVSGRTVALLENLGGPGVLELAIRLNAPFDEAHAGEPLAVALMLEGNAVPAEWSSNAVDVPPPSSFTLHWEAGTDGGEIEGLSDGTGGLRRSGLVRFPIPPGFAGHDSLTLRLATANVGHAEPARLAAAHFGAVIAEHRRRRTLEPPAANQPADPLWLELKSEIARWKPVSGQVLALPQGLVPVFEDGVVLRLADRSGSWAEWTPTADLAPLGPEDRRFTLDRRLGQLSFGDGYSGRVPAPASDIALTADLGGGIAGNHPAGLEWRGLADDRVDLRLRSAADATDGAEGESLADARSRAASSLAEPGRAVTEADYVHQVETTPGIGAHRAQVAVGLDPAFPCRYVSDSITVFVVPRTGLAVAAPRADDAAMARIRARLEARRMLTTRLFVTRPRFRPVALELSLIAGAGSASSFTARLRPVLAAYLHPAEGGPDSTGWPFGRPLRPSELIRVAQAGLHDDAVVERVSIRLEDEVRSAESCADVAIGDHDLVELSRLRVRISPPQNAGATL